MTSRDFFAWHDVFGAFREERGVELTERHALQVWQWIVEQPTRLEALVAESEGALIGFVHFRETVQPRSGDVALTVDDVYVVKSSRRNGVAGELVGAAAALASERGAVGIRLEAGEDDEIAQLLQDRAGAPTRTIVYTLADLTERGARADR